MLSSLKTTFFYWLKFHALCLLVQSILFRLCVIVRKGFLMLLQPYIPYFLRILLTVLSDIVVLQPDINLVHTCCTESLLFALEILFIILSCLCDNFHGLPERAKFFVFLVFRYFCQIFCMQRLDTVVEHSFCSSNWISDHVFPMVFNITIIFLLISEIYIVIL